MRQLHDQIVSSRGRKAGRDGADTSRTSGLKALRRTMQEAIGQQLKKEFEPPTELTTELATILAKMDQRKDERK